MGSRMGISAARSNHPLCSSRVHTTSLGPSSSGCLEFLALVVGIDELADEIEGDTDVEERKMVGFRTALELTCRIGCG
jgi:hypothetical protein